ncbi:Folylpolyglutamate synthetase like protein, partial [Aduncisulcus paluster]
LGGRLDATNVVEKPLVTVITPIALDHVNILGDTLEKVAFEKGGIIKHGVPLVIHPQTVEASTVLEKIADEKDADLIVAPVDMIEVESVALGGTRFGLGAQTYEISMIGMHQAQNA